MRDLSPYRPEWQASPYPEQIARLVHQQSALYQVVHAGCAYFQPLRALFQPVQRGILECVAAAVVYIMDMAQEVAGLLVCSGLVSYRRS